VKISAFPVLLAASCIIAGLYGVLHNRISYTISPDYFHAFKFQQFGIPVELRNRVGASIVGWRAAWWMGLIVGVPVLLVGLGMPNRKTYVIKSLVAIAIVAATTLVLGLAALAYANYAISPESLPPYRYPDGVTDRVAFARAGTMHNLSYVGALFGILTGSLYIVVERFRANRRGRDPQLVSTHSSQGERNWRLPNWAWIVGGIVLVSLVSAIALLWYVTYTINRFYFPNG
jgi:hypothetical protein